MSRTSGSQLDRVVQCGASAALPGSFDEVGYAAHRGTDIHRFIHTARKHGRSQALLDAPGKLREFCAAVDVSALDEYIGQYATGEPAFVYNALTRRVTYLGEDIDRKYPERQPGDFPFSSDYVDLQFRPNRHVVNVDIKTGRLPVKHPRENWQFRLGAIGCSAWKETDSALLVKAHLDEDAEWHFEEYLATSIDIDAWADELNAAAARVEDARVAVSAGRMPDVSPSQDACTYCPCKHSCPSTVAPAQALMAALPNGLPLSEIAQKIPNHFDAVQSRLASMTTEQLGELVPLAVRLHEFSSMVIDGLKEIARSTPLPLPNGNNWTMRPETREYIDDSVALAVLADKFGADALARAVKRTVSKTSLKALGKEQAAEAVEAIRAAGGIDVRTQWMPREEKVK